MIASDSFSGISVSARPPSLLTRSTNGASKTQTNLLTTAKRWKQTLNESQIKFAQICAPTNLKLRLYWYGGQASSLARLAPIPHRPSEAGWPRMRLKARQDRRECQLYACGNGPLAKPKEYVNLPTPASELSDPP